jgi:hypothetical protein
MFKQVFRKLLHHLSLPTLNLHAPPLPQTQPQLSQLPIICPPPHPLCNHSLPLAAPGPFWVLALFSTSISLYVCHTSLCLLLLNLNLVFQGQHLILLPSHALSFVFGFYLTLVVSSWVVPLSQSSSGSVITIWSNWHTFWSSKIFEGLRKSTLCPNHWKGDHWSHLFVSSVYFLALDSLKARIVWFSC